jgi:hypothetical protein
MDLKAETSKNAETQALNIPVVIGSVFKMQGKLWKVKTDGDNGWVGVECQDHNRAFTSERVEDVQKYLSEQHCR